MKRLFVSMLVGSLLFTPPLQSHATESFSFTPHFIISDAEFFDTESMTLNEIQLFLQARGALGDLVAEDVQGRMKTAAEIIWNASQEFQINPQFLLALLQREQSLVEDDTPSTDQLNWAMGYAICDDCSKNDPRLQKFRGFGNQVHYAAKRIRESYITDLQSRGTTISGVGPGIEVIIDGTRVTPANFATSSLYTYTPHLRGNRNFQKIWQSWFSLNYPSGTLLQDTSNGAVWLIQSGVRRPITSRNAFFSRYSPKQLIPVSASVISRYQVGHPLSFSNYSLLRINDETVYLLVDDILRPFDSAETVRRIGYSTDEFIDVSLEELEGYEIGEVITTASLYPQGTLIQDTATGGVFYVEEGVKHPILSREIFDLRFSDMPIQASDTAGLTAFPTGDPVKFHDGTLIAAEGSPDVFVVEHGYRRHIQDERAFLEFGWRWDNIVWTTERAVLAHPLGNPLTVELEELEVIEDGESGNENILGISTTRL